MTAINDAYANWIVGEPQKVALPQVHQNVKVLPKRPDPVRIEQDNLLLAVIHGYRKEGWRDPIASQTYLLKNAVGDEMKAQSAQDLLNTTPRGQTLPELRGDVIREKLSGTDGFIFWTGARYGWSHPPNP